MTLAFHGRRLYIRKADEPKEAQMILELIATRTSDRTWWKQVEWLELKGYKQWHNGLDARWTETASCTGCNHPRMDYRGFSIAGIVNRSFAVCDMCEHWVEF